MSYYCLHLGVSAIIKQVSEPLPANVGLDQVPLPDRSGGSQGQKDRTEWDELVVQPPGLGLVGRLESRLDTAGANARFELIQADVVGESRSRVRVVTEWAGSVDIAIDGEVGAHASLGTLVDVLGEKEVARLGGADLAI